MSPRDPAFRIARRLSVLAALASLLVTAPIGAQQSPSQPAPRIVDDRRDGEIDRIQKRLEWFYGSRRAGTASDREMSLLRSQAVEATRSAIQLQRDRWARGGTEAGGIGQDTWVSKGPSPSTFDGWSFGNVAGRTSAVAADWAAGVLYLGTASGGVWKSDNDGLSWTSIFDSAGTMTVGTVAVDPNDADVVWVGTGENHQGCSGYFGIGLLRSPDGGQTWEARNGTGGNTLDDLASVADIVVDPRDSDHVVTGGRIRGCDDGDSTDGGIFTTTDGGLSWTERLSGNVYEIVQDPTLLDTFWAATSAGVYKSIDNAVGWTLQTASGLPNGNTGRTEIAIAPSNSSVVYALFDGAGDTFWGTTDGGASWSQRGGDTCDGQCSYNMVLRVDPNDADVVYRGTVRIFKTVDGGLNWGELTNSWGPSQQVHQDTHVLMMHPTQADTFYVGSDGGLWKSVDGGSSFTNVVGNVNITQFYAVGTGASDPESIICGGAQDNSSLVRTTSDTWDLQFASGDGFVCHIDPQDPDRAYTTSYPNTPQGGKLYPSVYRSTGGLFGPWSEITNGNGIVGNEPTNWVTPYLLDPNTPNILYLGTHRVYRSTDYGSSWTPQEPSDMTVGGASLRSLELNRNFPTYLWAGGDNHRVWRTEDSGSNWVNITPGLPSRSIHDLASDPTAPDRVFAVVGGFNTEHLWEWTEASGVWTPRGAGLPNLPTNTVLNLGENDILVGNDVGVYRSVDGGVNFVPYMEGLPLGIVVTDLKFNAPDLVTLGSYGRGAWQVHVDPTEPQVRYDSVGLPLTEVDGDGDDKIEPGESWSVEPVMRNVGGQTALGVTARLVSTTPGVTVLEPSAGQFGDLDGGEVATASTPMLFTIAPDFPCGDFAVFDIVEIRSTNGPQDYPDEVAAFSVEVLDHLFSPGGGPSASPTGTLGTVSPESWARQLVGDQVWLLASGSDSVGGAGVAIPGGAVAARMSFSSPDGVPTTPAGGRLVIDALADGRDDYVVLDAAPFAGSFDVTRYRGQRVWIGFVHDEDPLSHSGGELEFLSLPAIVNPICDVTAWPGSVQTTTLYRLVGNDVEATWGDSCNVGELAQTYSIQAGDLGLLQSTGVFTHGPVGDLCHRVSPAQFTPGPANQYYLVVPNGAGREGGQGLQSGGESRPQVVATCGELREASCP